VVLVMVRTMAREIGLVVGVAKDEGIKDFSMLKGNGFIRRGAELRIREEGGKVFVEVKPTLRYTSLGLWYSGFQIRSFFKRLPLVGWLFKLFL